MNKIIWNAIVKANKLGRQGYRVISCEEPTNATDAPEIKLYSRKEEPKDASETPWWEK